MRLNVGDKQNNSFCLILWLGLHGFEKKRTKRRKRRKKRKKEEEKKIKVWNPYFWVFDLNPKVFGMEISYPLV